MTKHFCLFVVVSGLACGGCAGPRLAMPTTWDNTAIAHELNQRVGAPVSASRKTPVHEREAVVYRIDRRLQLAAVEVCKRTFNNPRECASTLYQRSLVVIPENEDVNAFVGQRYDLTILGGLVSMAGSDDEIASVLAHEYSHALLGHVARSANNSMAGMAIGAAIGTAIGVAVAPKDSPAAGDIVTDIGMAGLNAGVMMGQLAFSQRMELEADHLGLFILQEAGYNLGAASQFFLRMIHAQNSRTRSGDKGFFGIFRTHPTHEHRIQRLIATEKMIQQGARRPFWKKK